MGNIIGFAVTMGVIAFLLYRDKKKRKSKKEKVTVQDLLDFEEITDTGITKLRNGTYTVTLEVAQVNMRLKNQNERDSVWLKFRQYLNTVGVHQTLLVQSQYVDMSEYVEEYGHTAENVEWLTPQLRETSQEVVQHLRGMSEQKTRDYRSYVIFRYNPFTEGTEAGITTGNNMLDSLFKTVRGATSTITKEEAEELAQNVLDEISDIGKQILESTGIPRVKRLNRVGVLNMVYTSLNRDLQMIQRLHDASDAHSFSEYKQSITPYQMEQDFELIESEEALTNPLEQEQYEQTPIEENAMTKEEMKEGSARESFF